jgi:hypothetical protein
LLERGCYGCHDKNKNIDIKCSGHVYGITFITYTQSRKVGKQNNIKGLGNNKTKEPKYDCQNRLRSSRTEGGET